MAWDTLCINDEAGRGGDLGGHAKGSETCCREENRGHIKSIDASSGYVIVDDAPLNAYNSRVHK